MDPQSKVKSPNSNGELSIIVNSKNMVKQFDSVYEDNPHQIINAIVKYKVIIPLQSFSKQTPIQQVELKMSKCFYMCRFQHLLSLFFDFGHLSRLEFLSFIDAPVLINLVVRSNKATIIKSLNKQVFPKLGLLDMDKNPIQEINIERLKLSKFMRLLTLDIEDMKWMINHNYRNIINQDLSKLVKIQPKTIGMMNIKRNGRVNQKLVESLLHERFSSHQIRLEIK